MSPAVERDLAAELAEHCSLLLSLARRLTKGSADADDLVQDVVERALVKAGDIPPEKLRSWLITVLNNLFIDQCRKTARRPQAGDDAVANLPAPSAEPSRDWHRLDGAALRSAVSELPDEFAEVYRLHAFEKKSYAEISAALGVPTATIGTRLLRARKKLKTILTKSMTGQQDNA